MTRQEDARNAVDGDWRSQTSRATARPVVPRVMAVTCKRRELQEGRVPVRSSSEVCPASPCDSPRPSSPEAALADPDPVPLSSPIMAKNTPSFTPDGTPGGYTPVRRKSEDELDSNRAHKKPRTRVR